MEYILILGVGLIAGTLSGIVGFGSSIMLMPVLVIVFGPVQAVPIMAVAATMANLSRVMVWWREVDWRACVAYSIPGVIGAALGARTLLALPQTLIEGVLGAFFIVMIPLRHWLIKKEFRLNRTHMAICGLIIGYITGIVVSTGPISVPIFLAYGLLKGAFIATEAASSLAIYVTKMIVFREFGILPAAILLKGLIIGSSLMVGSYFSKRFVLKISADRFQILMDGLMLLSGSAMLWAAFHAA
ncbi:MAG TPA: sulfite exporter TauE/SafE family protein [Rhodocyclaceae bacterium]|nr:sulfite exporter TauE/SafE family protein [Rhodocyclaceae bacterium]